MTRPRVLLVYNQPVLPADHPDSMSEADVVETVDEVQHVLPPESYETERLGYARDPRLLLDMLSAWKPDVVFNLFEGEADRTATEIYHAGLMEWAGVRFTGSTATSLSLCRDKPRTKLLLQGAGLPTAPFTLFETLPISEWAHGWPAIVKPAYQDASVGIDQASVVRDLEELNARARYVFDTYGGPVLVEKFIFGREYHVNLYEEWDELIIVPPTELKFQAGEGYWPIYSYQGKWNESSMEYKSTGLETAIEFPSEVRERAEAACRAGYRLMGMRDYGRVDLRIGEDGTPYVLEANPNPHLNSIAVVDGMHKLGKTFADLIQTLVRNALNRPA